MLTWNHWNPMTAASKWIFDACEYAVDSAQRQILFMDVLRKRGNNYIEHLRNGQPPVLTFHYEMILDGRTFEKPVNFALVRIVDRRREEKDCADGAERRRTNRGKKPPELPKRPIVIIDPRAGHGPGIGGSKRDSEIGMALDHGHPVYFILFYTEPMPGQKIKDVVQAEERFIEEVVHRHPHADNPAIMGNCQAGWASALLCADRPDIAGPLILNGAPMSYWAGVQGVNPMRYRGGLAGGIWMTSLLCDLGNGKFDGANLVSNFESLNPANTLWTKNYKLYSEIDTEEERFLAFEKWWGGFYMMNAEEIHFIVSNLFVGNKLEKGKLELHEGEFLSLKNIQSPILVFASKGDNITPPQQALSWIPKVYRSAEEIRKLGQVIVYIIHEDIGHLGIFVAASVAKKEHKEIIRSSEMIEFLPPGLYEMVIEGDVATGRHRHPLRGEDPGRHHGPRRRAGRGGGFQHRGAGLRIQRPDLPELPEPLGEGLFIGVLGGDDALAQPPEGAALHDLGHEPGAAPPRRGGIPDPCRPQTRIAGQHLRGPGEIPIVLCRRVAQLLPRQPGPQAGEALPRDLRP